MFIDKFFYATGYYHMRDDGVILFDKDAPPEIKRRFEKEWREHLEEVKARRERGLYDSRDIIDFDAEPEFKIEYV